MINDFVQFGNLIFDPAKLSSVEYMPGEQHRGSQRFILVIDGVVHTLIDHDETIFQFIACKNWLNSHGYTFR